MRLVFDLETDGFLSELTRVHCLIAKDIDTGRVYQFAASGGHAPIEQGVKLLESADLLVGHNIIKFDLPAVEKVYGPRKWPTVADTLVMARILWSDTSQQDAGLMARGVLPKDCYKSHRLEAWGRRLGVLKGEYDGPWDAWSETMHTYAVQDVEVTAALWKLIAKRSAEIPNIEAVFGQEHRVATIVARQERHGFAFDEAAAARLYATLSGRREALREELTAAVPPEQRGRKLVPFNPGSRPQVARHLIALGWKPIEFTENGQPAINDDLLRSLPYPIAQKLADYYEVSKLIGYVAEGKNAWLKSVDAGRIHGSVNTNGAVTGRMTHSDPNLAQVPSSKAPYGAECRGLFIAPPGKRLVGVDASSLEMCCLAGYLAPYDGGEFIKVAAGGADQHSANAAAVGCTRSEAKALFYALIYGAGDDKLGQILGAVRGKGRARGKKARDALMGSWPAFAKLVEAVKARVKARGYLVALDGRRLSIRSEHSALNTLLQSAGAILMKRALVILDDALRADGLTPGKDYEFVGNIHDEFQIEVDEAVAETVGRRGVEAIAAAGSAYAFACPLRGEFKVGGSWAETH